MLHNAQVVGFVEGTPVLMADGKWKPIEQVQQGEYVMSFDPKIENSQLEPRKVTNTLSAVHRDCIEVHTNGKVTIVAKDQLFFTPGATWLPGYETKQVVDYSGNIQNVQVRRVRGGKFKVYDITVEETHSLIANDMRVHNGSGGGSKKKKVVQSPQPVVTAGKPGKPVSVTTTTNGQTTTVVVNPSPGGSGQVTVSANGTIGIKQNSIPGLPISDGTYYQPIYVMPYPGGSYVNDRVVNAEIVRGSVCGNMLDKGNNYRVTKADEQAWEAEIDTMIAEIEQIRYQNINHGPTKIKISADPTLLNDAISHANALKKEIKAGRKLTTGVIRQNCDKISNILARISGSVVPPGGTVVITQPGSRPLPVCPGPSTYHTSRIYDGDANYEYMTRLNNTCQFVFDPPNAPAITSVRYYRHWDSNLNRYYYDRVSTNATCSTFGGNTQGV